MTGAVKVEKVEIEMDFYFYKKLMMQLFTSYLFVKR